MSILTGRASDFLRVAAAAAGRGDLDTVRAVSEEKPAWIRRIGSHGRTLLWEAAYRGRLEVVDYLLDRGADVNVRNHKGQTALHCAAKAGFMDIVALLLDRGADVHATDDDGRTPLAVALRSTVKDKARIAAVIELLEAAGSTDRAHRLKRLASLRAI